MPKIVDYRDLERVLRELKATLGVNLNGHPPAVWSAILMGQNGRIGDGFGLTIEEAIDAAIINYGKVAP